MEEVETEVEEYSPEALPETIDVDLARDPERPLSSHYLKREAPGGAVPIAKIYGEDPEVAKAIVRRYNAFPDLVGVLQDIHTHTSDHDYAMFLAARVLEKYGLDETPEGYDPDEFRDKPNVQPKQENA